MVRAVQGRLRFRFFLSLLLLTFGPFPSPASRVESPTTGVTLRLIDASPEQLALALTRALGVEVVVESEARRRYRLELDDVPSPLVLERTAEAIKGRWLPVYRLEPGAETGEAASDGKAMPSGRTVTLRLEAVSARAALSTVARAAGGAAEAAPEIAGTVSISVEGAPVEEALDRLATQLGVHWRVRYRLIPGEIPPPAPGPESGPATVRGEQPRPVPLTPPRGASLQLRRPARRVPSTSVLRQLLTQDLAHLLATGPRRRRPAVRQYARRLNETFRAMGSLPPDERARRFESLRRYFQSGLRALSGLTPDQRHDFQPVAEMLQRWMP